MRERKERIAVRRPLVVLCLLQALGILLSFYIHIEPRHLCIILCTGAFVLYGIKKGRGFFGRWSETQRGFCLCMAAAFFLGMGLMCLWEQRESVVLTYSDNVAMVEGVVRKSEVKDGYIAVTVDAESVGFPMGVKRQAHECVLVRCTVADGHYDFAYGLVGRRIRATGSVAIPNGRRNPGCFNYGLYLRGRSIYATMNVSEFKLVQGPVEHHILNFLSVKKGRFFQMAKLYMDEESFSVMAGLLFGEKGYMEEGLYEEFQGNGIAHILAVSGLHVGLLYAFLQKLFRGAKNRSVSAVTLGILLVYAALSNFSVSVLRASTMICLAIVARHAKRRYDMVTAASVAAMIFMTVNPYQLFDSGFQLSFLAAYSIGVVLPWIELKLLAISDKKRLPSLITAGRVLGPCAAAQAGMSPLVAFHFLTFSPVGLLLNPVATAIAGLILPAGLLLFVVFLGTAGAGDVAAATGAEFLAGFGGLPGATGTELVFAGLAGVVQALCRALAALSGLAARAGGGGAAPSPTVCALALYYALFFFFFSELRYVLNRKKKKKTLAILLCALLSASLLLPVALGISNSPLPWKYNTSSLTFLDVGQGDCIHIHTENGVDVLVDGGGSYRTDIAKKTLAPYLLKNGITSVELAVVTHMDSDHAKGIMQLSQRLKIGTLVLPSVYRGDEALLESFNIENVMYVSAGDEILVSDTVSLHILSPSRTAIRSDEDNENSLVAMLRTDGLNILLTGDLEQAAEPSIAAAFDISCHILKVAHHGSNGSTTPEFLASAGPSLAVISCGRNNAFGHPSKRVIELLKNSGIITGRTDMYGALFLKYVSDDFFVIENAQGDMIFTVPKRMD